MWFVCHRFRGQIGAAKFFLQGVFAPQNAEVVAAKANHAQVIKRLLKVGKVVKHSNGLWHLDDDCRSVVFRCFVSHDNLRQQNLYSRRDCTGQPVRAR